MNAQQLRAAILQQAIEGKLVPQLDSEPAVEQIGDAPENVPFAIPEKWKWISFEHLLHCEDGKRIPLKKSDRDKLEKIYDYYGATGVIDRVDSFLFDGEFLLIGEDGANLLSKSKDNAFIVRGKFWLNNHAHIFRQGELATLSYVKHFINAISLAPYVTGSAQPKLTQKNLFSIPVSLPPIEEQRRIVAKLEELLPLVEEYGKSQEALDKLNAEIGGKLRASILQEAIQGKLVPQLDSEPAVEQISDAPEDVPFAIPDKWKWCRLSDVAIFNPKVTVDDELNASFLPMTCVNAGYVNNCDATQQKKWKDIKKGFSRFSNGDVLMAKITPCFQNRKSCIPELLINGVGAGSTEFHVLRAKEYLLSRYLLWFLKSPYLINFGLENFKGTAGQQRIGTQDLKSCLIPLPPLEEQRRIVAKIEELLQEVEKISR